MSHIEQVLQPHSIAADHSKNNPSKSVAQEQLLSILPALERIIHKLDDCLCEYQNDLHILLENTEPHVREQLLAKKLVIIEAQDQAQKTAKTCRLILEKFGPK